MSNTLAGYEAEIQSLNQKQFDQMKERPVEILEKLRIVTGYIPKDKLTDGLNLWLWNEALYEDLCKLERAFTDGADPAEVFSSKVSYVNTLYQNPLSKISLSSLSVEKSELLLYAITQKKKAFLNLINEEPELFYDLLNASMLLKKEMYQEYINLNTLNRKNLKDSADLILSNDRFELLAKREHTFEELKLLCTAKEAVIRLYEQLTCKCDERLLVLRELIKREVCAVFLLERTDRTTCSCVIPKAVIQMDPGGLLEHSGFKLRNGTVAFGVPRAAKRHGKRDHHGAAGSLSVKRSGTGKRV